MTTQHTPGPWKVTRNVTPGQFGTDTKIRDSRDGVIAVMHVNADANARLIAAAPAMLKALQRLTHPMADDDDLAHALDVIARATGQPVADEDEGPEPPYAGYESEAQLRRMAEVRALRAAEGRK